MFELNGSAQHTFLFPATVDVAFEYYRQLERVLPYLPSIMLADTQPARPNGFRLVYETKEMGVYEVQVVCDVVLTADKAAGLLRLQAAEFTELPPIEAAVKPNRTVATGRFELQTKFTPRDSQTEVQLSVQMVSKLPAPDVPAFVPVKLIMRSVSRVAQERLRQNLMVFGRDSVVAWRQVQ